MHSVVRIFAVLKWLLFDFLPTILTKGTPLHWRPINPCPLHQPQQLPEPVVTRTQENPIASQGKATHAIANAQLLHMGVSINRGTPQSSILIRFSPTNHPFWGTPIYGNPPYLLIKVMERFHNEGLLCYHLCELRHVAGVGPRALACHTPFQSAMA